MLEPGDAAAGGWGGGGAAPTPVDPLSPVRAIPAINRLVMTSPGSSQRNQRPARTRIRVICSPPSKQPDPAPFCRAAEAVGWAQDYARLNREVMMERTLRALRDNLPKFKLEKHAVN